MKRYFYAIAALLSSAGLLGAVDFGAGVSTNTNTATAVTEACNEAKARLGTKTPVMVFMTENRCQGGQSALTTAVNAAKAVFPGVPVYGYGGVTGWLQYHGYNQRLMVDSQALTPVMVFAVANASCAVTSPVTFGTDWWNITGTQLAAFSVTLGQRVAALRASLPSGGSACTIVYGNYHGGGNSPIVASNMKTVLGDSYPFVGGSMMDGYVNNNGTQQWNALSAVIIQGNFSMTYSATPENQGWWGSQTLANHNSLLAEEAAAVQVAVNSLPTGAVCKGLFWINCNGRHSPMSPSDGTINALPGHYTHEHLDSAQSVFGANLPLFGFWAGSEIGKADNAAPTIGRQYTGVLAYFYEISSNPEPVKLGLSAFPTALTADGTSTSILTVECLDAENNLMMSATNNIRCTIISGPGTLVGTNPVNASGGIARLTYRAGTSAGTATIQATSPGLTLASTQIVLDSPANQPPATPSTPSGPASLQRAQSGDYTSTATDPEGNQLYYTFDWNDGTTYNTGLVNSGTQGQAAHMWNSSGTYNVRVSATDSNGATSSWSATFSVTVTAPYAEQPVLSVVPSSLDFGKVPIGEQRKMTFIISNKGDGTLNGNITTDRPWLTVTPATINSNSVSVQVTVNNFVLSASDGQYSGVVSVQTNGGNANVTVNLTASCVLVRPSPAGAGGTITFFGDGIVPGATKIRIYSLSGELVRTIDNVESETCDVKLDGIDPGVYIYLHESPKEKGVGKFTVVK